MTPAGPPRPQGPLPGWGGYADDPPRRGARRGEIRRASGAADHRLDRVEPLVQELAIPVAQLAAVALAAHQLLALDRAERRGRLAVAAGLGGERGDAGVDVAEGGAVGGARCSRCRRLVSGRESPGWPPAARRRRPARPAWRRPAAACRPDPAAAARRRPARRRSRRRPGRRRKRGRRGGSWRVSGEVQLGRERARRARDAETSYRCDRTPRPPPPYIAAAAARASPSAGSPAGIRPGRRRTAGRSPAPRARPPPPHGRGGPVRRRGSGRARRPASGSRAAASSICSA